MRNARLDDLKFQWNRTKFYIKDKIYEIPDIIGYWSGKELVLDKLEPGEYRLKYFGDSLNEKYCVIFTVENNITAIPLSVPEWATAIYVYKSNGLYVGKVRITQINSIGTEGVSKEFVENYAQPKGDYLTQADKETIIQEVIDTLGTPVFGTVDEENNIILSGNLAEGTYNLKYENRDGTTNDIGSITIGGEKPAYTNWIQLATDTDGSIYNGIGYKTDTRLSSSNTESTLSGYTSTGYIPVNYSDTVRTKNISIAELTSTPYCLVFKPDKTLLSAKKMSDVFTVDSNENGTIDTALLGIHDYSNESAIYYIRITYTANSDAILTINEEIS